jgi:hypothetical protein
MIPTGFTYLQSTYLHIPTKRFTDVSAELIRRHRVAGRSAHDADGSRGGNLTRKLSSRSCGGSRRLSTETWNQFFNAEARPEAH